MKAEKQGKYRSDWGMYCSVMWCRVVW